ncbi:MAG: SDR family NAD(P)-dependent oxidoreductase, partial [Betaproteobacteria bacterium]|nr:SDR family NAD(P)-dependent oxidoreductase [Betaproteobacteria bacterium]
MELNGHQRLSGKVAIITGAGRGIGRATALKFGKEGARIAACDINADLAQETAQPVVAAGGEAMGCQ